MGQKPISSPDIDSNNISEIDIKESSAILNIKKNDTITQDILVRTTKKEYSFTVKPVELSSIITYEYWVNSCRSANPIFYNHVFSEVVKEVMDPQLTVSALAKQYTRIYTKHKYSGQKYYIDLYGTEINSYYETLENAQACYLELVPLIATPENTLS